MGTVEELRPLHSYLHCGWQYQSIESCKIFTRKKSIPQAQVTKQQVHQKEVLTSKQQNYNYNERKSDNLQMSSLDTKPKHPIT